MKHFDSLYSFFVKTPYNKNKIISNTNSKEIFETDFKDLTKNKLGSLRFLQLKEGIEYSGISCPFEL